MKNEADPSRGSRHQGRDDTFMDVDRMVNEGLGGGRVTLQNGLIGDTTTDTMSDSARQSLDE